MLSQAAYVAEASDEFRVDRGGGFAVQLLEDDGAGKRLKGRLLRGKPQRERAGALDELRQLWVGGRERGDGGFRVIGEFAGAASGLRHEANDTQIPEAFVRVAMVITFVIIASMQLKVRKIGNGYGVLLPKQLLEEMALEEGSLVDIDKLEGVYRMTPADAEFTRQVEAFLRTEPLHRNTYRELAK